MDPKESSADSNKKIFYVTAELGRTYYGKYKCLCCPYTSWKSYPIIVHITDVHPQYVHEPDPSKEKNILKEQKCSRPRINTCTEKEIACPKKRSISRSPLNQEAHNFDGVNVVAIKKRRIMEKSRSKTTGTSDDEPSSYGSDSDEEIMDDSGSCGGNEGKSLDSTDNDVSDDHNNIKTRFADDSLQSENSLDEKTTDDDDDNRMLISFLPVNRPINNNETEEKGIEMYEDVDGKLNDSSPNNDDANIHPVNNYNYTSDHFEEVNDVDGSSNCSACWAVEIVEKEIWKESEEIHCPTYKNSLEISGKKIPDIIQIDSDDDVAEVRGPEKNRKPVNDLLNEKDVLLKRLRKDNLRLTLAMGYLKAKHENEMTKLKEELSKKNEQHVKEFEENQIKDSYTASDQGVRELCRQLELERTKIENFEKMIAAKEKEVEAKMGGILAKLESQRLLVKKSENALKEKEVELEEMRELYKKNLEAKSEDGESHSKVKHQNLTELELDFKRREEELLEKLADTESKLNDCRKVNMLWRKAEQLKLEEKLEEERVEEAVRVLEETKRAKEERMKERERIRAELSVLN